MAFHIQIVSEKVKNRTKNVQKPSQKGIFISTSDHLAEFGDGEMMAIMTMTS